MFEQLDDSMRRDDDAVTTPRQRWTRYAIVLLVSIVFFGGLYALIRFVEA